jgi:hypothetical protein
MERRRRGQIPELSGSPVPRGTVESVLRRSGCDRQENGQPGRSADLLGRVEDGRRDSQLVWLDS